MSIKMRDFISGVGIISVAMLGYVVLLQAEIRREKHQAELETARKVLGMEDLRTLRELQEACGKDCRADLNFVPPSD